MMDNGISMNGEPSGRIAASTTWESPPVAAGTPIVNDPHTKSTMNNFSGTPNFPMQEQAKLGSKCCGCCCDFRRAVLILDSILIISALLRLIIALTVPVSQQLELQGIEDDEVIALIDDSLMINNIITGVGLLCLAVPVYGALKYNVPMIAYGVFWLVASFIVSIIVGVVYAGKVDNVTDEPVPMPYMNWIISGVFTALYIYPHVGLISEINKGIMSVDTYPREEFSCCCSTASAQ